MVERTQPLSIRLRTAARERLREIGTLPFFDSMSRGPASLESYIAFLRVMAILHQSLEDYMIHSRHPVLKSVWRDSMRKLPLLDRDFSELMIREIHSIPEPIMAASLTVEWMRYRMENHPVSILGYLYVLEAIIQTIPLDPVSLKTILPLGNEVGLNYISSFDSEAQVQWQEFEIRLDNVELSPADEDAVIAAECEAFQGISKVIRSLAPEPL